MKRWIVLPLLLVSVAVVVAVATADGAQGPVERGSYVVNSFGCFDCHTPQVPGPTGLVPDRDRWMSGHPETLALPPAPKLPEGPWKVAVAGTLTAWSGPWGTSFTANLTPDPETGIGTWTEDQFVQAIRTGRHQGMGRPILPPMPIGAISNMTDGDLRAVFAYLKSLKPIRNRVPDPIPPADAGE
jgi:hypothetical protein